MNVDYRDGGAVAWLLRAYATSRLIATVEGDLR